MKLNFFILLIEANIVLGYGSNPISFFGMIVPNRILIRKLNGDRQDSKGMPVFLFILSQEQEFTVLVVLG